MADGTEPVTATELGAMPRDGMRYELVEGIVRMMSPTGGQHGRIASKLLTRIAVFVEQNDLGHTFAAETGFLIGRQPDTVRAPDVAFVSHARIGGLADLPGYLPLAPDFVAEVVSPNDRSSDIERKAKFWVSAGVALVLVVDPQTRTIHQYQPGDPTVQFTEGVIEFDCVLSGLRLDLVDLFK